MHGQYLQIKSDIKMGHEFTKQDKSNAKKKIPIGLWGSEEAIG